MNATKEREGVKTVEYDVKSTMIDVAYWFLLQESMSHKKIQKLCYYGQAWSCALLDKSIAKNAVFEAWVHGPVNQEIWAAFRQFGWQPLELTNRDQVEKRLKSVFNKYQLDVLNAVWETYGDLSADELESLTHNELPWSEQRHALGEFENCNRVISEKTMKSYYLSKQING